MTTMTASHALPVLVDGRPTAMDRALLRMARVLEAAAIARMQRRTTMIGPRSDHTRRTDEHRLSAAAMVYAGMLPR
ncbi:hypothetical protein [Microbacterium rhizomatis]|uniref:Uncharacterized protein n=1 Tax=Microbacterium rhizomatis TaxID=1631477 RepID=A0A5J5J5M1_9MICO|nr:hypothetical protein [Microbacterium rhizomatis]KAA9110424.1 hypothetical protein F6B43_01675 [Microbacterium rhizomatis]